MARKPGCEVPIHDQRSFVLTYHAVILLIFSFRLVHARPARYVNLPSVHLNQSCQPDYALDVHAQVQNVTIFEPTSIAPIEGVSLGGEVIGVGTDGTTFVVSYVTEPTTLVTTKTTGSSSGSTFVVEELPFTGSQIKFIESMGQQY